MQLSEMQTRQESRNHQRADWGEIGNGSSIYQTTVGNCATFDNKAPSVFMV